MDTAEQLACDLSAAHPLLASRWGWSRIIHAAARGSNNHLTILAGTALVDRALGVVACLREEHEHGTSRLRACDGGEASAMRPVREPGHALGPTHASREVWSAEEFTDRDAVSHAPTMRAPAAVAEVAS